MNKTININLGGIFFHIDEIAYQKLKRYLDAVRRSLSDDPKGRDEIITDIESRIGELLSDKVKDVRQVVNEQDIDEVIEVMGKPEDYMVDDEIFSDEKIIWLMTRYLVMMPMRVMAKKEIKNYIEMAAINFWVVFLQEWRII